MVPISPLSKDNPSPTPLSSPRPSSQALSPATSTSSSSKPETEVAKKMLKGLMEMFEEEEFISLLRELGLDVKKEVVVTTVPSMTAPPPVVTTVPLTPPVPAAGAIPAVSMTAPPPPPPPAPIPIATVPNWKTKGRKVPDKKKDFEQKDFRSELAIKLKAMKPQLPSAPRVVHLEIGSVEESPQVSFQSSQIAQKVLKTSVADVSLLDTPADGLLNTARPKEAENSSLLEARDYFEAQKMPSAKLRRQESSKLVRCVSRKPSVRKLDGFQMAKKKFEMISAASSQTSRPRRHVAAGNSTAVNSTAVSSTTASSSYVNSTDAMAASYRRMRYADAKTSGQLPPPSLSSAPSSSSKIFRRE